MKELDLMCVNVDCPEHFKGKCGKRNAHPKYCGDRVIPKEYRV